jgi:ribosomal protein L32
MAVPKKKTSPSKRKMKRAHYTGRLKNTCAHLVMDKETGEYCLSHRMSIYKIYKGKKVKAFEKPETPESNNGEQSGSETQNKE